MRRLFFGLVIFQVFVAGGLAVGADESQKIDELISKLGQRNFQSVVDALVRIGDPAVEPLIQSLKDNSVETWTIHARAIDSLAKIKTPRAVEAVVRSLKDADLDQYARGYAAMAVAELKPEGALEALTETLTDKSQFVRWKSVQALGALGHKQGTNALIRALEDEDQYVRAAAVKSLQQIQAENAAIALVDALNDDSWLVRLNSREALTEMDERVFDPLIKALKVPNGRIQWQAAWVLGRTRTEEAIEPLVDALADLDWMVRDEAAVALTRINSDKIAKHLAKALKDQRGDVRRQATWILEMMKSGKNSKGNECPGAKSGATPPDKIYCRQKVYPCYPEMLNTKPDIPSPHTTMYGAEVVTAFTKDGRFTLIPVMVENGKALDYKRDLWGRGQQLKVDTTDFPTLARTGLHSETELDQTKMITGLSIVEITELGRPERLSGAGFMGADEDILSVLKGDNQLVAELGLKHPQMARPLFHVWNMILRDCELNRLGRFWNQFEYIVYHNKKVLLKATGGRGWQESLFDDEILGKFRFEIWRELDRDGKAFLRQKYPHLTEEQMTELFTKLSRIHTGEMLPYYIMRYGFYEGHTEYRADPIAIAWIFGLKNLEQIEATFPGRLDEVLTKHFTRQVMIQN